MSRHAPGQTFYNISKLPLRDPTTRANQLKPYSVSMNFDFVLL